MTRGVAGERPEGVVTDLEMAAVSLFEHLGMTPERGTALTTADSILLWVDPRTRDMPEVPKEWQGFPVAVQRRPRIRARAGR